MTTHPRSPQAARDGGERGDDLPPGAMLSVHGPSPTPGRRFIGFIMDHPSGYTSRTLSIGFGETMEEAASSARYNLVGYDAKTWPYRNSQLDEALALAAATPAGLEDLERFKPNPLATRDNDEPAMVRAAGGRWVSFDDVARLATAAPEPPDLSAAWRVEELLRKADWFGPPGVYPLMGERWDEVVRAVAQVILRAALAAATPEQPQEQECPECEGHGWIAETTADPLPSGEPGEPYQVQATCLMCGGVGYLRATPEPPKGTRLVLMAEELFSELGASRIDWGEPDEHGWYTPTLYRATPGPPDLSALRRLSEAASPGRWAWRGYTNGAIELRTVGHGGQRIISAMRGDPCLVELDDGSIALTRSACPSCRTEYAKPHDAFVDRDTPCGTRRPGGRRWRHLFDRTPRGNG